MRLPRLYPILDASVIPGDPYAFARELAAAGCSFLQFRGKGRGAREQVSQGRELARILPGVTWIMNDRSDLAVAAGFQGVHVGQDDLSPEGARRVCPRPMVLGISTHDLDQLRAADRTDADYIAVGPVFATASKADPDPVVGLAGVRAARRITQKPLVAIGGITVENCQEVIAAGADSVAVISGLLPDPRSSAAAFWRRLG